MIQELVLHHSDDVHTPRSMLLGEGGGGGRLGLNIAKEAARGSTGAMIVLLAY